MENAKFESIDFADIYQRLLQYYGPQSWWPARHTFEVIVGAVLTQNTAWHNVELALGRLRKHDLLNWPSLLDIPVDELQEMIRSAGFYCRKAACIQSICRCIKDEQGIENFKQYDYQEIRQKLLSVNGIGQETADAILLYAFDKPVFVIDKYTHRIFCRLTGEDRPFNYNDLQESYVSHLTEDVAVFQEYHALIVAHAKQHCRHKPDCETCPLNDACRYNQCKLGS